MYVSGILFFFWDFVQCVFHLKCPRRFGSHRWKGRRSERESRENMYVKNDKGKWNCLGATPLPVCLPLTQAFVPIYILMIFWVTFHVHLELGFWDQFNKLVNGGGAWFEYEYETKNYDLHFVEQSFHMNGDNNDWVARGGWGALIRLHGCVCSINVRAFFMVFNSILLRGITNIPSPFFLLSFIFNLRRACGTYDVTYLLSCFVRCIGVYYLIIFYWTLKWMWNPFKRN